jgi:acyl-CoA synthetase (AMP-forming)/AMP-acid ligase II
MPKHMACASLPGLLDTVAKRYGDTCAIVEGGTRLTFADLTRESRRVAAGLRALGLQRGDALAVWLPNFHEWLVLEYACARLGLLMVALNTRLRTAELGHLLSGSNAKALVLAPSFLGVDFLAMARDVAPDLRLIAVREAREGAVPYAQLREHGEEPADGAASDLLNVFPTSGTTASPKLAAHDQVGVARHAQHVAAAIHLGRGDVMLMSLPLCGVFGFNGAMAALVAGATLVLQVIFNVDEAARLLADEQVTHFYGPDSMLRAVIASRTFDGQAARTWRWGGYANFTTGRPLELVQDAEARAGVKLVGLYGSSECFALMSSWRQDDQVEIRAQAGGFPVSPEIQVRAGDPDSGAPLVPPERGELQVRGYNVMREYLGNPQATRAAFTPDGWFRTGDLGYVNADGSFVFLTRLKDSLRVRGYLVDPAEVEEYLLRHSLVALAQVVGVRTEVEGDVPVAFVRLTPGTTASEEDLLAYCRQGIAGYKVPRKICLLEEFPVVVGPNGVKIQRHRLREMAAALLKGGRP